MLAQSKAGRDPFQAPPPPARKRDVESFLDPDIREFETVLEGSRLYVLTALFIASQGASWVLLKVSLVTLPIPKLYRSEQLHLHAACRKCLASLHVTNPSVQGAVEALPTPALLVFLHCVPAAALLLWLHRWTGSSVNVGPFDGRSLKGSLAAVVVHSTQVGSLIVLSERPAEVRGWLAPGLNRQCTCTRRCSQRMGP